MKIMFRGKEYRVLVTFRDSYSTVSEDGFEYKVFPRFEVIK